MRGGEERINLPTTVKTHPCRGTLMGASKRVCLLCQTQYKTYFLFR